MENPESVCRRIIHLADLWPEIQRLIDATVDGSDRYGRGGRGHVTGNAWDRRGGEVKSQHYQSGRGHSTSFEHWETENNYSGEARITKCRSTAGPRKILTTPIPVLQVQSVPSLSAFCRTLVQPDETILWDERYATGVRRSFLVMPVLAVLL